MGPDQALFERCDRNGYRMLIVSGEIDLANASEFGAELDAIAQEAHSPALVDMSAVSFVDSSGLNALIKARERLEGSEVSLILVAPSKACRRVLAITGTDTLFEIVECPAARSASEA